MCKRERERERALKVNMVMEELMVCLVVTLLEVSLVTTDGKESLREVCVTLRISSNPKKLGRDRLKTSYKDGTRLHLDTSSSPTILDWELEQRFLRLKKKVKSCGGSLTAQKESEVSISTVQNKCKKPNLRVSWDDQKGGSLT